LRTWIRLTFDLDPVDPKSGCAIMLITSYLGHYLYCRQYVNHCLANLNRAGTTNKRVHFATLQDGEKGKKMRSKAAVKYAATKLHEKVISPLANLSCSNPF
jgi:hypothetical protein